MHGDHDVALRRDIAAAAAGELRALIVLRGTSSTGKTRSLFEAVRALCPGWMVVRPRSVTALRRLSDSGVLDRPCVVWLNELQGYLGPNEQGLSQDVLHDLLMGTDTPVVLVGTLWPEKLRAATDAHDERLSDSRALLVEATEGVRWHEVPPTLTATEQAHALALDVTDARLVYALADPDRFGFAQTLAGAHELMEQYRNAPAMARLLLDAAADARRLGHSTALTAPLLQALTLALWREQHCPTQPRIGWFEQALDYASVPLRSHDGVRALIPLGDLDALDDPGLVGYDLADYLLQHLTRSRRTCRTSDRVWAAMRQHTSRPDDLFRLARVAARDGTTSTSRCSFGRRPRPATRGRCPSWRHD